MRRNPLAILVLALAVAGGSIAVAGCGGGGSKSSAPEPASTAKSSGSSTKQSNFAGDDCTELAAIAMDLGELDSTGAGFDYVGDRNFMDGFADRAPGGVSESARTIRDLLDKFADAAQDAGVAPNADPSEDQIAKIRSKLDTSSDQQAENGKAIAQLTIYAGTSC